MNVKINVLGHRYLLFVFSVLVIVIFSSFTQGCADDPSSLGLKFIPPNETTGVKIFDSYTDTMDISLSSIKRAVNTSSSTFLIVGQNANCSSKAVLKFNNINSNYDSANMVNSAVLKLKYKNYYYPSKNTDSLAQLSFDIFKVQQSINFSTFNTDSVTSSTFGNTSQGSYTGFPTADTQEVDIQLNPAMVKDWLEYAADTSYAQKNYGIVLSPNAGSGALKGFYSGITDGSVRPSLVIIVTKNNDPDTITANESSTLFLANGTLTPVPERFLMQGGISFMEVIKLSTNKIPSNATINDVQLILSLDKSNSSISPQSEQKMIASFITDTSTFAVDGDYSGFNVSDQFTIRITYPFQRWLVGQANYGSLISPSIKAANTDLFAFYDMNSTDAGKRPRVIIRYTPRVNP
jgi:hypothetical protein